MLVPPAALRLAQRRLPLKQRVLLPANACALGAVLSHACIPPLTAAAARADDTIAVLLGLAFCLICPIIAPMAAAYFGIVHLVQKYNQVGAWWAECACWRTAELLYCCWRKG